MGADQGDDDDDVNRFYRCLATSIDFIDVSRCLATSTDVDTCIGGADGRRLGRRRRGRQTSIYTVYQSHPITFWYFSSVPRSLLLIITRLF